MDRIKKTGALALLLLAASCATEQHTRRAYVDAHPELEDVTRQLILEGKIAVGMTKDEVRAAWGPPCSDCFMTHRTRLGETWEYNELRSRSPWASRYVYFDTDGLVIDWDE